MSTSAMTGLVQPTWFATNGKRATEREFLAFEVSKAIAAIQILLGEAGSPPSFAAIDRAAAKLWPRVRDGLTGWHGQRTLLGEFWFLAADRPVPAASELAAILRDDTGVDVRAAAVTVPPSGPERLRALNAVGLALKEGSRQWVVAEYWRVINGTPTSTSQGAG